MSCSKARATLLQSLRGAASESELLLLDLHLGDCEGCSKERAHSALIEPLRRYEPPALGELAERRIINQLTSADSRASARRAVITPLGARPFVFGMGLALAAAVLLAVGVGSRTKPGAGGERPVVVSALTLTDDTQLSFDSAGSLRFAGSEVIYERGTAVAVKPRQRTLELKRGRVDIDVTPGWKQRYRVITPHFVVEVLGTRFVVDESSVRTSRGKVRVLDIAGRELAVVHAGEAWRWSPPPASPSPFSPPPPASLELPPAPALGARAPEVHSPSASALLARARRQLTLGESDSARALIRRVLELQSAEKDQAQARLLLADSYLMEKRSDEAIASYRQVAREFARRPEGELAAFAVGQLLSERGDSAAARAALAAYLRHYPGGRLAREARERLSALDPPPIQ